MIGRWILGVVGLLAIAFGMVTVLVNWEEASPFGLVAFLVAVVILDDLILMPIALGVGWVVGRALPGPARAPAQIALVVLAGLLLVGVPFALSPARDGESGTLLTEPYWRNLGLLSASLAVPVAIVAVLRIRRTAQART